MTSSKEQIDYGIEPRKVTRAETVRFLRYALRNWGWMPQIKEEEIEDVRDALEKFAKIFATPKESAIDAAISKLENP